MNTTKRVLDYDDEPSGAAGVAQVREPDADEADRVTVHANGVAIDVIAREDGSVYVEAYAYADGKVAVVQHASIDAYTTQAPSLTLGLVERSHPAVNIISGKVPAHAPGAYPSLSCCGGSKVRLVAAD